MSPTDAGRLPGTSTKEDAMQSVNLSEAEYYGKVSTLPRNREVPRQCRACGSQLGGRRYKGVQDIGGEAVRVWECDCGAGRRMPVEAAAA
jgi:hypothetical protein